MVAALAAPVEDGVNAVLTRVRFPLLDPAHAYDPNTFDYNSTTPGQPGRAQWLNVFR